MSDARDKLMPVGGPRPSQPNPGVRDPNTPLPNTVHGTHRPVLRPPQLSPFRLPSEIKAEESRPARQRFWFSVSGLAGIALIAYVLFQLPALATVANGYTAFAAGDETFTCEVPSGWQYRAMGNAAARDKEHLRHLIATGQDRFLEENGIAMQSGSARIEITFSKVAALIGTQLLYGDNPIPESLTGSRSHPIDRRQVAAIQKQFLNYQETPEPNCPNGMGGVYFGDRYELINDARLYTFTAQAPWQRLGGKVHGYRAVLSGYENIASIVCYCPENQWPRLKPLFEHIIASVHEIRTEDEDGDIEMMKAIDELNRTRF